MEFADNKDSQVCVVCLDPINFFFLIQIIIVSHHVIIHFILIVYF